MQLISTEQKNNVLNSMANILEENRSKILLANKKDLSLFDPSDRALYDRLIVDDHKIDEMIKSILDVKTQDDPVGKIISHIKLENGLIIENRTAPFGTIMIIYESRPDVTIEAAVLAFKANSKIILKGGKEASHSNEALVQCWHKALKANNLPKDCIELLKLNREETQQFLKNPPIKIDLVVPRGGEKLIDFVKENSKCAVLVSGRGNNFLYVHSNADWNKAIPIILNSKTQKISACNALDKILLDKNLPEFDTKLKELREILMSNGVEVALSKSLTSLVPSGNTFANETTWYEEFLAMKIVIGAVEDIHQAVSMINTYSGGHSSCIITENTDAASQFMNQVDSAAVYLNASTRFTDGGQMGVGAELAISTDKLHHRGPLGLAQLVTNKYYVFGNGQIRS